MQVALDEIKLLTDRQRQQLQQQLQLQQQQREQQQQKLELQQLLLQKQQQQEMLHQLQQERERERLEKLEQLQRLQRAKEEQKVIHERHKKQQKELEEKQKMLKGHKELIIAHLSSDPASTGDETDVNRVEKKVATGEASSTANEGGKGKIENSVTLSVLHWTHTEQLTLTTTCNGIARSGVSVTEIAPPTKITNLIYDAKEDGEESEKFQAELNPGEPPVKPVDTQNAKSSTASCSGMHSSSSRSDKSSCQSCASVSDKR